MNTVVEQLKALRKSGVSCKVRYGKKLTANGIVTDLSITGEGRVWVRTVLGEIGIPLRDIRRVDT